MANLVKGVFAYFKAKSELPEDYRAEGKKEGSEGRPGGTIGAIAGGFPDKFWDLQEIAATPGGQGEALQVKFDRLLDLLLQKGLITEREKQDLLAEKDTA